MQAPVWVLRSSRVPYASNAGIRQQGRGANVRLYSRPGNDLTKRFPLVVETPGALRCNSCVIDGEAVACGADGRSNFDFIRYRHHDEVVFLYAFDLLRLGVDDLRRDPLEVRKATLGPPSNARIWHPIQSASRAMPKTSSGTPAS